MPQTWRIAGYTVELQPGQYQAADGFEWIIRDRAGYYRTGGWERTEVDAFKACLGRLETLCKPSEKHSPS